jgi:hypothetical protein
MSQQDNLPETRGQLRLVKEQFHAQASLVRVRMRVQARLRWAPFDAVCCSTKSPDLHALSIRGSALQFVDPDF